MAKVRKAESKVQGSPERAVVPAPSGLRAKQFEIDGEEYAVLVYPLPTPSPAVPARLTAAEAHIVDLVLRGFTNEEIAAKRSSSPRTVANQLQAIYRKLGIGSRIELVRALAAGTSVASRAAPS